MRTAPTAGGHDGRRLLYLVTEDWYFCSHRLPMARAARAAGFEVHVATRVSRHGARIEAEGFRLHALGWQRGSTDPKAFWASIREVRRLYRSVRPHIAHHVALQPSIVGSLAALGLPVACLNAVAGLGYAFTSRSPRARLTRAALAGLIRVLFGRRRSMVLVQNPDDRALLQSLGISAEKIALIAGSGVDVQHLQPLPEPDGPVTAAYVGRLLADKGLDSLMAAQQRLVAEKRPLRLLLAGDADPANPASIPPHRLAEWRQRETVEFLGHVDDVRTVWAAAHIAVLPSRREGLPLSLLEAAACGRPIVATDVPGCREIVRDGVNGLLVPVDDVAALTAAMARLAADHSLRARLGAAGRALAEQEFSSDRIGSEIMRLYRSLLHRQSAGALST